MSTPKIINAPDSIWLCYDDIEKDCTHGEVFRDGVVSWCETKQGDADVKYIRVDIVDKLREELDITQRALLSANFGAEKLRIKLDKITPAVKL